MLDWADAAQLPAPLREAVCGGNAARLLGLPRRPERLPAGRISGMELLLATTSQKKLAELMAIFRPLGDPCGSRGRWT